MQPTKIFSEHLVLSLANFKPSTVANNDNDEYMLALKEEVKNTLCKGRVEADPEPVSEVVKPLIYSSISEVFSTFLCTDDEILKQDVKNTLCTGPVEADPVPIQQTWSSLSSEGEQSL
jgi:hypothetical protein